jgi:threonine dehydratase
MLAAAIQGAVIGEERGESSMQTPTFEHVEAAARRIAGHGVETPLLRSAALDAATGGRILLKAETLQRVGAFKFRGAYNKISQIDRMVHPGGVVACSSGNHAQGVAEAARLLGLQAVVVMPADAPRLKIERTKAAGAEVVPYDRETEDREAISRKLANERGAAMVHPFDDPDIIAGQGTAGLELMRQAAALGMTPDAVIAPCSGGGLSAGVSLAVKQLAPKTEVWAAEPAGFDDLARSLRSGKRERNSRTAGSICDALLAPSPGEITFAIARRNLAGSIAVSDDAVRRAMRFAYLELKLVVEPGGATGLAAVLEGLLPAKGRTVVVVLSGGNVDPAQFAEIIA